MSRVCAESELFLAGRCVNRFFVIFFTSYPPHYSLSLNLNLPLNTLYSQGFKVPLSALAVSMCVHLFAAMLLIVASRDTPKHASTPDSPLFDVKYLDTMREVKVAPPPVVAPAADSVAASAQRPALNVNQSAASESPKPSTPIEPISRQAPSAQNTSTQSSSAAQTPDKVSPTVSERVITSLSAQVSSTASSAATSTAMFTAIPTAISLASTANSEIPKSVITDPTPTGKESTSGAAKPASAPLATVSQGTSVEPESVLQPITLPNTKASYLNNPQPETPYTSRTRGENGLVILNVLVSAKGFADSVNVRKSSGYPRLDEAALVAVKNWKFVPGTRKGMADNMWFQVPILFP